MGDLMRAQQKIDFLFADFLDEVYDVQRNLGLSLEETLEAIKGNFGPLFDIADAYQNWYEEGEG
jgi:hypothetical protein